MAARGAGRAGRLSSFSATCSPRSRRPQRLPRRRRGTGAWSPAARLRRLRAGRRRHRRLESLAAISSPRMPAYVIADVRDARDPEALAEYRRGNTESVASHGGRFIVRGGAIELLEGEWDTRRIVIIEFADMAAARVVRVRGLRAAEGAAPVGLGHQHHPRRRADLRPVVCERVQTSAGSEPAFVFPARRGRIRLALTPARIVATSAMGKVELPWKALAGGAPPGGRRPSSASPRPARGRGVDARRLAGAAQPARHALRGLLQGRRLRGRGGGHHASDQALPGRRPSPPLDRQRGGRRGCCVSARHRLIPCWSDVMTSALGSGA